MWNFQLCRVFLFFLLSFPHAKATSIIRTFALSPPLSPSHTTGGRRIRQRIPIKENLCTKKYLTFVESSSQTPSPPGRGGYNGREKKGGEWSKGPLSSLSLSPSAAVLSGLVCHSLSHNTDCSHNVPHIFCRIQTFIFPSLFSTLFSPFLNIIEPNNMSGNALETLFLASFFSFVCCCRCVNLGNEKEGPPLSLSQMSQESGLWGEKTFSFIFSPPGLLIKNSPFLSCSCSGYSKIRVWTPFTKANHFPLLLFPSPLNTNRFLGSKRHLPCFAKKYWKICQNRSKK